jgi:hypothetical protein
MYERNKITPQRQIVRLFAYIFQNADNVKSFIH